MVLFQASKLQWYFIDTFTQKKYNVKQRCYPWQCYRTDIMWWLAVGSVTAKTAI
jgi:hypothetical protein